MHPRSVGLRGGGASPQRCYVGVRLVLSAHNHVVVGWPTTSFGTLKLLPTKGGTAVGRAQGDTRGVAKCVGKSREENANKHRGCLLLAKGETTMGRASVVARGRDANKHRGCLLPTMGGTAMGQAKNGHRGCSLTTMGGTAVGRRPPPLLLHTLQSVGPPPSVGPALPLPQPLLSQRRARPERAPESAAHRRTAHGAVRPPPPPPLPLPLLSQY